MKIRDRRACRRAPALTIPGGEHYLIDVMGDLFRRIAAICWAGTCASLAGRPRGKNAMSFQNRSDAGRRLARALLRYRADRPVVLALPRGGVPVAAEIAVALDAPLDLLFVRKIGVPAQPELAMGAVADGGAPVIVRNEDVLRVVGVGEDAFAAVARRELAEIERRRRIYVGSRPALDLAGRTVIVVDDGVATGATTRAGLKAVRARNPGRLVLAVPVASTDALAALRADADDIVCLEDHESFAAIGFFYRDFSQVSDQEVVEMLRRLQATDRATPGAAPEADAG